MLCDRLGLEVTVCHYPTGCSKWNPIEHRLFSFMPHTPSSPVCLPRRPRHLLRIFAAPCWPSARTVSDPPYRALLSAILLEIRDALARQATALQKISSSRLDVAARLRTHAAASDPRARCDQLLERAHAIFGARFVILPRIACDAATAAELTNALNASTQQQAGDPFAVHGWFIRSARVRDQLARLAACMRGAEVLGTGDRLSLRVAQLPFQQTERWVGLPPLPGTELAPSKLSTVIQSALPINAAVPLSGVFVDEWIELVPNRTETTALAFQLNPPNSFAPHNVLIAVPPVPGGTGPPSLCGAC